MKQALILFTRIPVEGKTKTRLQPALTRAQCVEAHCAFLQDIAAACADPRWDLLVFYSGEGPLSTLRRVLGQIAPQAFFPQQGDTLGERMDRAIADTLAMGYGRCVLVGADLPELDRTIVAGAMQQLQPGTVVLGPTVDGGYYLIASTAPCPQVFAGQHYGGANVLENTVAAARAAGFSVQLAPALADIDRPEDLRALAGRLQNRAGGCAHSRAFLQRLGWL